MLAVSGLARSTFFDHQRRLDKPDKYADLKEQITTIFHDSNATFGYRRIWRALRNNNTIVNKKVVQRLMRGRGQRSSITSVVLTCQTSTPTSKRRLRRSFTTPTPRLAIAVSGVRCATTTRSSTRRWFAGSCA
ncbi:hypothetical protein BT095_03765, partial [Corynebacterium diphtheriae]